MEFDPVTIADLHDPDKVPKDLHAAHECNDEVLGHISSEAAPRTNKA
uniref:Uncharacterized protein n=1 Tax=Candidatus Kentrum sp. FW TaxID=2126338 RepID=A0A450T3E4_9GAMM|nr:MAG: hypothetical protein BECKFW1821A_GA0114235_11108 [Candidatus Kentron sp. FW]VFJ62483.1 MAG: hypothetical protein BECKFW1821B_GA0114236_107412 [Candidatus Kentron sp. FW]